MTQLAILRDADWFDGRRARAYLFLLAALSVAGAIGYVALSHNGLDPNGKPLGTDFASFWTASQLALAGHPADAWDIASHRAAQAAMFGTDAVYAAFFYPPPYLLVCLPLALAPYFVSLFVWLGATGAAWAYMVRAWLRAAGDTSLGWLPILVFPAVMLNVGHGQNGFLTAALFGAGALLCDRRPWLGGALFGALVVKPHLAVLVPVFLLMAGNWRSFVGAGLSAAGLSLLSLAVFGPEVWQAFLANASAARGVLDNDLVGYGKLQSTFTGIRVLGGGAGLAITAQVVTGLLAVSALWIVRRHASGLANGAALVCATFLTTPFLLDYDFTLLAVPLAWLFARAQRSGFLPWERVLLLAGFVLPLFARPLAMSAHIPIAPLVIGALLLCIVRRAAAESESQPAGALLPAR